MYWFVCLNLKNLGYKSIHCVKLGILLLTSHYDKGIRFRIKFESIFNCLIQKKKKNLSEYFRNKWWINFSKPNLDFMYLIDLIAGVFV